MTDEQLVADEIANLDRVAADITPGLRSRWEERQRDDEAVYAHLRAWGLRHLPVGAAAQILRQELHDTLAGRPRPPIARAEPVWWLGVVAKRAGFNIWDYATGWGVLHNDVLRQVMHDFRRKRVAAKMRARKAAAGA